MMSAVLTAQDRARQSLYRRRSIVNVISVALACATAVFGLIFLAWILWTLIKNGIPGLSFHLFTQDQPPPGETSGGLRNAFVGSLIMCGMAVLIGTPIGIAAGTWLAEYGDRSKLGTAVRFVNDILMSAPSIVLGLFVYAMYVLQTGGQFSAVAGAIALAFIVLPVVVRTTDEMLRLVPTQMREAALSLGVPQWKVIMQVLYRSARAKDGAVELQSARWGLVPAWRNKDAPPAMTFNARAEEAAQKPTWRDSLKSARGLMPARGWYEWRRNERTLDAAGREVPQLGRQLLGVPA